MPLGERAAGSGLQVALESGGGSRVGELERYDERPWAMIDRDA